MWAVPRPPCEQGLIRPTEESPPYDRARGNWILAATILASAMAFIDGTVVNVALPALQARLNATATDLQWVIEAYSLLLSALLVTGGSLGDKYGRRRVFLIGVVLFAFASAACGLAGDVRQLIAARAFQGLGAALLVPGSLAIISSSFPEHRRARAIGSWSGATAITTVIGPVMGGWLIEHISWRAVFFINVPLAIVVVLLSLRHIPGSTVKSTNRIDWAGAVLAAAGLAALVYGLIESARIGFASRSVIAFLVAGAALLLSFVIVEASIAEPMLPLRLFRSSTFSGANLLTFLLYAALGGTLFFLPLNLIQVQHYSATAAGAALLPFILLISILSRWSGTLVARFGAKIPLVAGPLIAAVGFVAFSLPAIGGTYWSTFFPAIVVLGLGMAISVAPLTTTVMSSVDQDHAGIASGINNAVARSAGLMAIAAFGIVMLQVFDSSLNRQLTSQPFSIPAIEALNAQRAKLAAADLPEMFYDATTRRLAREAVERSFVTGFRTIMIVGAGLAAAGGLTAAMFIAAKPTNDIAL